MSLSGIANEAVERVDTMYTDQIVLKGAQRLMSATEVAQVTSLSRAGIYRLVESGGFPAPARIGPQRVAWPEQEVSAWVNERLAARVAA